MNQKIVNKLNKAAHKLHQRSMYGAANHIIVSEEYMEVVQLMFDIQTIEQNIIERLNDKWNSD